jgi:hypothetical protein
VVLRHLHWNRGGDTHRMMLGDDIRGDVWTVAGAWRSLRWG